MEVKQVTKALIPNPYSNVRYLCHAVKAGSRDAVLALSRWYAGSGVVSQDTVVVPVPQHTGKATYMLAVAEEIRRLTGCTIADVLRCMPREQAYILKKEGKFTEAGIYCVRPLSCPCLIIDNVADTWKTINSCRRLLPLAEVAPFAVTGGDR